MRKIMNNLKKVGLANIGSSISRSATGVAVALVLLSGTAFATAIGTGQGNSAGTVLVNSSGIFFSNFVTVPSPTCTSPGCTGSYTGATGTVQGSLVGAPTLTPNIADWAEFSGTAAGLIKIDLNTLNAGFGSLAGCSSNAIGSLCTPTGSPITIAQVGTNSVSISLSGNGIAYTGTSGSGSSPTIISFTSQNNVPGTITAILAAVNSTGFTNSVSATYSSTGPTTVPEPMTLSMMGLGLISLGLIARRRKS
jgi:PEP-CTERM motif